jgi:hypothetical protein
MGLSEGDARELSDAIAEVRRGDKAAGAAAIGRLSSKGAVRAMLVEGTGLEAIIEAMGSSLDDASIQASGCEVVAHLNMITESRGPGPPFSSIFESSLFEGSAPPAFKQGHKSHTNMTHVNPNQVIANVAASSKSSPKRLSEMGGVAAAFRAMKEHPSVAAVQRHACCCLLVFCSDRGVRARISKDGGVEASITAMVSYP